MSRLRIRRVNVRDAGLRREKNQCTELFLFLQRKARRWKVLEKFENQFQDVSRFKLKKGTITLRSAGLTKCS